MLFILSQCCASSRQNISKSNGKLQENKQNLKSQNLSEIIPSELFLQISSNLVQNEILKLKISDVQIYQKQSNKIISSSFENNCFQNESFDTKNSVLVEYIKMSSFKRFAQKHNDMDSSFSSYLNNTFSNQSNFQTSFSSKITISEEDKSVILCSDIVDLISNSIQYRIDSEYVEYLGKSEMPQWEKLEFTEGTLNGVLQILMQKQNIVHLQNQEEDENSQFFDQITEQPFEILLKHSKFAKKLEKIPKIENFQKDGNHFYFEFNINKKINEESEKISVEGFINNDNQSKTSHKIDQLMFQNQVRTLLQNNMQIKIFEKFEEEIIFLNENTQTYETYLSGYISITSIQNQKLFKNQNYSYIKEYLKKQNEIQKISKPIKQIREMITIYRLIDLISQLFYQLGIQIPLQSFNDTQNMFVVENQFNSLYCNRKCQFVLNVKNYEKFLNGDKQKYYINPNEFHDIQNQNEYIYAGQILKFLKDITNLSISNSNLEIQNLKLSDLKKDFVQNFLHQIISNNTDNHFMKFESNSEMIKILKNEMEQQTLFDNKNIQKDLFEQISKFAVNQKSLEWNHLFEQLKQEVAILRVFHCSFEDKKSIFLSVQWQAQFLSNNQQDLKNVLNQQIQRFQKSDQFKNENSFVQFLCYSEIFRLKKDYNKAFQQIFQVFYDPQNSQEEDYCSNEYLPNSHFQILTLLQHLNKIFKNCPQILTGQKIQNFSQILLQSLNQFWNNMIDEENQFPNETNIKNDVYDFIMISKQIELYLKVWWRSKQSSEDESGGELSEIQQEAENIWQNIEQIFNEYLKGTKLTKIQKNQVCQVKEILNLFVNYQHASIITKQSKMQIMKCSQLKGQASAFQIFKNILEAIEKIDTDSLLFQDPSIKLSVLNLEVLKIKCLNQILKIKIQNPEIDDQYELFSSNQIQNIFNKSQKLKFSKYSFNQFQSELNDQIKKIWTQNTYEMNEEVQTLILKSLLLLQSQPQKNMKNYQKQSADSQAAELNQHLLQWKVANKYFKNLRKCFNLRMKGKDILKMKIKLLSGLLDIYLQFEVYNEATDVLQKIEDCIRSHKILEIQNNKNILINFWQVKLWNRFYFQKHKFVKIFYRNNKKIDCNSLISYYQSLTEWIDNVSLEQSKSQNQIEAYTVQIPYHLQNLKIKAQYLQYQILKISQPIQDQIKCLKSLKKIIYQDEIYVPIHIQKSTHRYTKSAHSADFQQNEKTRNETEFKNNFSSNSNFDDGTSNQKSHRQKSQNYKQNEQNIKFVFIVYKIVQALIKSYQNLLENQSNDNHMLKVQDDSNKQISLHEKQISYSMHLCRKNLKMFTGSKRKSVTGYEEMESKIKDLWESLKMKILENEEWIDTEKKYKDSNQIQTSSGSHQSTFTAFKPVIKQNSRYKSIES